MGSKIVHLNVTYQLARLDEASFYGCEVTVGDSLRGLWYRRRVVFRGTKRSI